MWKMTKSNYYEVIDGTTMYYESYVKKLQEENARLKETLENNSKIGITDHKYASMMEDKYLELQQENKSLKEKIDIAETNYDIIYGYFTQVNELLGTELCEEVLDEILKLKRENEQLKKNKMTPDELVSLLNQELVRESKVLIEFEKWLEERLDMTCGTDYNIYTQCLDKLQELKEGKK